MTKYRKSRKPQGWYCYERIGFIPPDHCTKVRYTCSDCDYEGVYLLPGGMTLEDELYCVECKSAITKKWEV